MEALTVATAALTVYDMCKAVDKDMVIDQIRLVHKVGGERRVPPAARPYRCRQRRRASGRGARAVAEHAHHEIAGRSSPSGIITVSDSSSRGEREDLGAAIREVMLSAEPRSGST